MSVNKFDEYLLDSLLENVKNDLFMLIFSTKLRNILEKIEHPVAKKLLSVKNKKDFKSKITLLDIDESDENKLDNISFTMSNKLIENIIKDNGLGMNPKTEELSDNDLDTIFFHVHDRDKKYFTKSRSTTTLGKIVNKLFPSEFKPSGDPGNDIESFVNMYKSLRTDRVIFDLVEGDDIKFWYLEENYCSLIQGPLHSSCMRESGCTDYIDFYSKNVGKVKLLILKDNDDNTKIKGRALVWTLDFPENRIFMDRIYHVYEQDVELFKEYAKKNEWIRKMSQDMDEDGPFLDNLTGENIYKLKIDGVVDGKTEEYPYMDTLKYYDGNILTNDMSFLEDISDGKKLESTGGDYDPLGDDMYFSEFYGEWIDLSDYYNVYYYCERVSDYRNGEDCYHSEYYDEYIADDYASNEMEECDHYDERDDRWRESGDYVTLDNNETSTEEYAKENFIENNNGEWLSNGVWSEHYEDYIDRDSSVEVYTDVEENHTDYRLEDDDTYFKYDYNGELFDNDISLKELDEYNDVEE